MKVILDPGKQEASAVPYFALDRYDLVGKTVLDVPEDFRWTTNTVDWDTLTIVTDMTRVRAARWAEVKAKREVVQSGGCDTPAGRVQTDAGSRAFINGLVLSALAAEQVGAPFSDDFTLSNDLTVEVSGPQAIALGQAVGAFISAAHAHSLRLRAAIEGANTPEEIAAIDIDNDWPT